MAAKPPRDRLRQRQRAPQDADGPAPGARSLEHYAIAAKPGEPATFYLMSPGGTWTEIPAASVPPEVQEHAAWLAALADGRPPPPGKPPPVLIAPARPGAAFVAMVSVQEDDAR
jgi:hypothetical protein